MWHISRIISLLIAMTSIQASTPCFSQAFPATIRYVETENAGPISYMEMAEAKGILPDSARLVFASLGVEALVRLVPDIRKLPEIRSHNAHASSIVTAGELRIEDYPDFLHVCKIPMMQAQLKVIGLKGGPVQARTYEELRGYKVGIFNVIPIIFARYRSDFSAVEYYHSSDAMVKALLSGRVDLILLGWQHALAVATHLGEGRRLQQGVSLKTYNFHLAISRSWANSQEQLDKVCNQMERLKHQGKFDEIQSAYYNLPRVLQPVPSSLTPR